MNPIVARLIRVFVSGLWGASAAWLFSKLGIAFSESDAATIQAGLIVVCSAFTNAAIGWGSKKWPWLELLLGVPVRPVYMIEAKQ